MIRPPVALVVLAALAGGALFQIAFEVSELEGSLASLNDDISAERNSLHVLRAEWTHLNRPERLADLSVRYLDMEPITAAAVANLNVLPYRVPENILAAAQSDPKRGLLPLPRHKPIGPPQFASRKAPMLAEKVVAAPAPRDTSTFDDLLVQILQPLSGGT